MDGVTSIEVYGYANAPASAGYTVSLKDGVKDADKWTVKVGEGLAQALPIGGLKGDGSETVTLQYTGRLKVKGVKAVSEAAAPAVPDGAISGVFSVSDGKQVYFSKGNLRYASSKWCFFDNQYDYYTSYSADAWDHFGWSTSTTDYGMNTSENNSTYSGDFVDWGATMGTGWFTLTKDEWTYLLKNRSASTVGDTDNGRYAKAKVNNVPGVILFPDTYTQPDGVTAPTGVNATNNTGWNRNSYTIADWTKMESAGCVFLPAAGYRGGTSMSDLGTYGYYWSATPDGTNNANYMDFYSDNLNTANVNSRRQGCSVRLVQEVATSDAPAEEPVTLATPLTIEAITDGTIQVNMSGTLSSGMKYSVNGGTKTLITTTTSIEGLKAGDKVQFYGNGTSTQAYGNSPEVKILGSGDGFKTNVYGNIMSLLDEEGFATKTDLPDAQYVFYGLFNGNTTLNDASELLLPATQLAKNCYEGMFVGCTNLIKAPALPATQLAANCYSAMFNGCSALTAAPVLPATQLVMNCYHSMFNNCKKLATVTCLATSGINQNNSTSYWLQNAGSQADGTKTFNAVSTANWPSGFNGIPTDWTRVNIDN
jgi:hypothetical protein